MEQNIIKILKNVVEQNFCLFKLGEFDFGGEACI